MNTTKDFVRVRIYVLWKHPVHLGEMISLLSNIHYAKEQGVVNLEVLWVQNSKASPVPPR